MLRTPAARRTGVRLIALNRPDYGASNASASAHLTVADDVIAVADQLRIDRFAVLGISIGCPYAFACPGGFTVGDLSLGHVGSVGAMTVSC